jgi:hypothetical protein
MLNTLPIILVAVIGFTSSLSLYYLNEAKKNKNDIELNEISGIKISAGFCLGLLVVYMVISMYLWMRTRPAQQGTYSRWERVAVSFLMLIASFVLILEAVLARNKFAKKYEYDNSHLSLVVALASMNIAACVLLVFSDLLDTNVDVVSESDMREVETKRFSRKMIPTGM